ncbi:hypothetical protein JB92DRAFT_3020895 [Gautieria morchelliformis]|nr:hypothetical protein JB92DRAFT_3020895 [Gautieria morchelliformis]
MDGRSTISHDMTMHSSSQAHTVGPGRYHTTLSDGYTVCIALLLVTRSNAQVIQYSSVFSRTPRASLFQH